jgi:hypothetical protein
MTCPSCGFENSPGRKFCDAGAMQVFDGSSSGLSAALVLWTQDSSNVPGDAETGDAFGMTLVGGDFGVYTGRGRRRRRSGRGHRLAGRRGGDQRDLRGHQPPSDLVPGRLRDRGGLRSRRPVRRSARVAPAERCGTGEGPAPATIRQAYARGCLVRRACLPPTESSAGSSSRPGRPTLRSTSPGARTDL